MRLIQLLTAAETGLGYQLVESDNNGYHIIEFVKDNVVHGSIKANSQGTSWNLPDDVAALS